MNAVCKENHGREIKDMKKLGWIADGGKIRQRIKNLVKRREPAEREEQRSNAGPDPKPKNFPLRQGKDRVFFSQRLQGCPKGNHRDEHARIYPAARLPQEMVPGRRRALPALFVIAVP